MEKKTDVSFAVIRYAVSCWLRYARQCPIVSFERGGVGHFWGHPDIFAVDKRRQTYDVEIKMSLSDFKADGHKEKFQPYAVGAPRPTFFYYACRESLGEKISPLLPPGAGLIVVNGFRESGQDGMEVRIAAKKFPGFEPKMADLVSWVKDQSGTLCGLAKQIASSEKDHTV